MSVEKVLWESLRVALMEDTKTGSLKLVVIVGFGFSMTNAKLILVRMDSSNKNITNLFTLVKIPILVNSYCWCWPS